MKLAISCHNVNGEVSQTHVVSRRQAYHGNTIGAMSISSHLGRKAPYETAFNRLDVSYVSPAYAYRSQHANKSQIGGRDRDGVLEGRASQDCCFRRQGRRRVYCWMHNCNKDLLRGCAAYLQQMWCIARSR